MGGVQTREILETLDWRQGVICILGEPLAAVMSCEGENLPGALAVSEEREDGGTN